MKKLRKLVLCEEYSFIAIHIYICVDKDSSGTSKSKMENHQKVNVTSLNLK